MAAAKVPEEIVNRIVMDARQLRNLETCNEIRRIQTVSEVSVVFFGKTMGSLPRQLQLTYEILVQGAPDSAYFDTERGYERAYAEWREQNKNNMMWKSWPRSALRYLL